MKDLRAAFDDLVAVLADEVHNILCENQFNSEYNIRYNAVKGAYVSTDDYCMDQIILRHDRKHAAMTFEQLKNTFRSQLSSQPVWAV